MPKKIYKVVFFTMLIMFFLSASRGSAAFLCTADLNGNGVTGDKGELQECWTTDEMTQLCPLQAAGCTASYVPTICPGGGVLNPVSDQCELPGGANCPTGYVYDPVGDTCTAPADCGGGTLDTVNDMCWQDIVCPVNFTYIAIDATTGVCMKPPICPPGGSYDDVTDRCKSPMIVICPSVGYIPGGAPFTSQPDLCVGTLACPGQWDTEYQTLLDNGDVICKHKNAFPTPHCPANLTLEYLKDASWLNHAWCTADLTDCPEGTYNPVSGNCELSLLAILPPGYVWDATMGAYLGDPACPAGTVYNPVTDICEVATDSFACPNGFTPNAGMTGCELPKCPNGTWIYDYAYATEKCKVAPVTTNCPAGFILINGLCMADTTCPVDSTYSPVSGKCVYDLAFGCSAGYTYNAATGRCEEPPICPAGTSYDTVKDQCVAPNPAVESCPLGAYPCDGVTGMCVWNYPCSTNFTTQAICQQSCDGTCTSVCNTDAISAFGDVFWTGTTATTWYGITGVSGSGSDLIFYGKDVNLVDIPVGTITMNGCTFTGSASYFVETTDACSSTAWGLSGLSADAGQLNFFGGECGVAAGSITISGCYIQTPQSSGNFDLTHIVGTGTNLTFYSGLSGINPITTIGLCHSSWQCSTCSKTAACNYSCPDPSYMLSPDFKCVKYATCDGTGTLSAALDVCEEVVAITCPAGYTAVGDQCQMDPICPGGSSYDTTLNKCTTTEGITCPLRDVMLYSSQYVYTPADVMCYAGVTCPAGSSAGPVNTSSFCTAPFLSASCPVAGTTYNSATNMCEVNHSGTGVFDAALDKYIIYPAASCPAGWTLSGEICSSAPQCPAGSTWQVDIGQKNVPGLGWTWQSRCAVTPTYNCPAGYTWGSYLQWGMNQEGCLRDAQCNPGDVILNKSGYYYCTTSPLSIDCSINYAYDSTLNGCFTAAICEIGALDTTINSCTVPDSTVCPIGFASNPLTLRCEALPICNSPGIYSGTLDMCDTMANYNCPVGYTFLNGVCYSLPNCPSGTYDAVNNQCFTGLDTCTIGPYPCYTYMGSRLCSPNTCVDQATAVVVATDQATLASPKNDGTTNAAGNCSGQFYALSGTAGECRAVGTQTVFKNCCNSGTGMNPLYCDPATDGAVATKVANDQCHYVDTYCSETWAIVGCVQSKKVYCCFNSMLAKLINEQGRTQLASFQTNMWGTALNPRCRGFTPEELQMLDFSQIDLSAYFGSIQTNLEADVKATADQKIQNYNQNVQ